MKEKLISDLRLTLNNNSDSKIRNSSSRFFKKGEAPIVYGIKTAKVHKIASDFRKQLKTYSKDEIFAICEELWKSQYLEEAIISCKLTESLKDLFAPSDFEVFEHWVNEYVSNWAACDTLCNHTIGTLVLKYPKYLQKLKIWTKSPNRWTKRASAVTLIIPARRGLFLKDIFEIADLLLLDKDDMVQKGYGWMLKAASESNPKEVFNYVVSKKGVMPRTALRYAIEKLPKELKAEAMKK